MTLSIYHWNVEKNQKLRQDLDNDFIPYDALLWPLV